MATFLVKNPQLQRISLHNLSNEQNSPVASQASSATFPEDTDYWINEYLNPEVLLNNCHSLPEVSIDQDLQSQHLAVINKRQHSHVLKTQPLRNKSIFHNFQKHLITLLKKIICVKRCQLQNLPCGLKAYELWKIFRSTQTYSKKNLYIIFGVAQHDNDKTLQKIAEKIPQLQKMLQNNNIETIEAAQKLLRDLVYQQATQLPQNLIKSQCKMTKFEEFYGYYSSCIAELQSGALSKRMTKQQKYHIIEEKKKSLLRDLD